MDNRSDYTPDNVVNETDRFPEAMEQAMEAIEGRTSAVAAAIEGRFCAVCGNPFSPRRQNGFCSDRCRMRHRRAADKEWFRYVLATMTDLTDVLRSRLVGNDESDESHGR